MPHDPERAAEEVELMAMAPSLDVASTDNLKDRPRGAAGRSHAHVRAKLTFIHATHGVLIALHVVAVVTAIKGWQIRPGLSDIALVQTGITAVLQVASTVIVGVLISLTREVAVDGDIRAPPTLGLLHLRLHAWSGLASSASSNWRYARSYFTPSTPEPPGLKSIFLYLGFCALLQLSSGSIFAISLDTSRAETLSSFTDPDVLDGARIGDYNAIWPSEFNLSSTDTNLFPPAMLNAAVNMFAGRTNDTRYPGLHGRLLHDTVNLDNSIAIEIPWTQANVNATLVNVHCSQVSNATVTTFSLPFGSTNMSLAVPSPIQDGTPILFSDDSKELGVWINISMPAPPYMAASELNISGYWGTNESPYGLSTTVLFQPWTLKGTPNTPIGHGHHQVVMVIATQTAGSLVTDSNNSTGHTYNFQARSSPAWVQVIGCTVKHDNLTATIDTQSRLLDPLTTVSKLIGPEAPHDDHAWDEFAWQPSDNWGITPAERQFLFAFRPSVPAYNDTAFNPIAPVGYPENVLAKLLDGGLFTPFDETTSLGQRNPLVNFQGSLERLFASYLWNFNRLCSPFDDIQPYWETCGTYADSTLFSPAEFVFVFPLMPVLIVVLWRAIVSLVCSVLMWLTLAALGVGRIRTRGPTGGSGRASGVQQAQGLLDMARLFSRGSRVPEVVAYEAVRSNPRGNLDRALLEMALRKRLRYVEEDDGLGGHLDVVGP
ncbi:hypothetical protein FB45DRAFT_303167 [Roridomyces roridus]|uniref:Uncharacterized protein n=1 Tax=Roridomyces roridus TaxID=1738132 RepID=A0AAD7B860_9AGAR|nr:hypothetical protein FB45DRAFT_303167 [Roridomyces roridus]